MKSLSLTQMEKIEGSYFWGTHCWIVNSSAADPGGAGTMCCEYAFWVRYGCTGPGIS